MDKNKNKKENKNMNINFDDYGKVKYIPGFINKQLANRIINDLKKIVPWEEKKGTTMDNKKLLMMYAMKNNEQDLTKVYNETSAMVWMPTLNKLKQKIEKMIKRKISHAELIYLRNGNDYRDWYSDDQLKNDDIVVCLSLGETRKIKFRPIYQTNDKNNYELEIENRSLTIMDINAAKNKLHHKMPKTNKEIDSQISIIFRHI